ncbi:aldose 1-epimerase [Clostridia bacterium]|nr:aldose 1-epimerase [Clostridia bacterium]
MEYTLTNLKGWRVVLTEQGAAVREIHVPDKDGKLIDVALACGSSEDALVNDSYFGVSCGRVANRISNARFFLDGKEHKLTANIHPQILHGGTPGFSHLPWTAKKISDKQITFTLHSPDGDQGFPAAVDVSATYSWSEDGVLGITYEAVSDAPTIVNLTNHTYFNLNGQGEGSILDHELTLKCEYFLPVNEIVGVTGEIFSVSGTPMDFNAPHKIRERIFSDYEQLKCAGGYDHSYVISGGGSRFAKVVGDKSGIVMEVCTDYPAVQLYAGCNMKPTNGKNGAKYDKFGGVCLETQYFPDFINQPTFENHILRPGDVYRHHTDYAFSTI